MNTTLTADTPGLIEMRPHHFTLEASTAGLPPGVVPQTITTTLGNGRPFRLVWADESVFNYRQELGCLTLDIFND